MSGPRTAAAEGVLELLSGLLEAAPDLRQAGDGPPVSFDDIMDALRTLDGEAHNRIDYGKLVNRARRLRDVFGRGESGTGSLCLS